MEKKGSTNPLVSVILATFNEPKDYIAQSVTSLTSQDYRNLEIIIADDSTSEETIKAIDTMAAGDSRIRIIRKEVRMGFVNALNYAMKDAKGELIARMDGDDISLPNRLSLQVAFAQEHPEIDVFGGSMYIINENDEIISERNYPISRWSIYKMFLYRSPFAHPTIMFRRDIIDKDIFYNPEYKKAEDIDFYMRLWQHGYHFGNLGEKLLKYRVMGNLGSKRTKEQWIYNHKARKKIIWTKPIFTLTSYLISYVYLYIPRKIVSTFYKKENGKLRS